MEFDVKIGVGCIIPHSSAGYTGGGKIVIPGLAGFETIEINHAPAVAGETGGIGVIEGNEFRLEVEEVARTAGLEFIANVVVNSRRGIAGIFVGDQVVAHREGVRLARKVYATPKRSRRHGYRRAQRLSQGSKSLATKPSTPSTSCSPRPKTS